jgi:hypothetical protein
MQHLRERFEAAHEAFANVLWRFRTGLDADLDLGRLDETYGDVTQGELADYARKALESATLESARDAWRRLRFGLEREGVRARTRALWCELSEREARTQVRPGGVAAKQATLYAWRVRLGVEDDPDRRARIGDALDAEQERLDELRTELFIATGEALASFGHATRADFERSLSTELDLEAWARGAEWLLEATEGVWRDGQGATLGALGIDPAHATRADEAWVARLPRLASRLPREHRSELVAHATLGLGLRGDGLPGVEYDLAPRAGKHPSPRCVALRVPGDVRVILSDAGGVESARALLHQTGRALALSFSSAELPAERRLIGDPALGEYWGELFGARLADPEWLAELVPGPMFDAALEATRQQRRARLRRTAALARLEVELLALGAGETPWPFAERYAEELTRATGYRYRRAGYLAEIALRPRALHQLRAACLEVRVAEWLRLEFGRRFWRERRACELWKELWNTGTSYDADGLAAELGLGALELEPLIESLLER